MFDGDLTSAAQVGQRLFVAGGFRRVSQPSGGAVVVDATGLHVPGAFPRFTGHVQHIVGDGLGGFLVVGDFTGAGDRSIELLNDPIGNRSMNRPIGNHQSAKG